MSTLANTQYDTLFQLYNGNLDTSTGTTFVRVNPDNMYNVDFKGGSPLASETGYKFRNMQKFNLDMTGHTDDNPLRVEFFTFANGVKYVKEFAYATFDSDIYIGWRDYYEDADGNYIDVNTYTGRYITDFPNKQIAHGYKIDPDSLSSVEYWYGSPGYIYDGDESRDAYSLMGTGISFLRRPSASPYESPALIGNLNNDYVSNYFSGPFYSDLYSQTWIDLLYECLENNGDGTPIIGTKPEDDTSKPDPDPVPDYNPFSDPIGLPDLPITGDSLSTGFIRAYTPSGGQLRDLASVLWSDNFVNTIKKVQNDPFEAIISLHSVPFNLTGISTICQVGNFVTNVTMPELTRQFYQLNLGSIHIPEHWASALDYSPYVTIDIFLPFVGVVSLQVDDVIGKTLTASYNVDVLSGATCVSLKCGDSVLYTYNTNVLLRHPVTQSSYGPLYQSIISMVGVTVSGAVSGGIGGAVGGALGSAINTAMSKHTNISRGGSIGGATGVLGHFTPYLIIHRPIQSLASGFKHFKGYPSNITATIGSVSGYSEIESVHLTGIPCTDIERDEINALLYNGVIV